MIRPDRRVVVRPRLPREVIAAAELEAAAAGQPLADYLGDLVAAELPSIAAEAVRLTLDIARNAVARATTGRPANAERSAIKSGGPVK